MALRFYNTATRSKENFVPLREGNVGMYVCGVTPYDDCHIGHAMSYINFDVVRRYLEYLESDVDAEEKLHLAMHLRFITTGWTPEQRLKLCSLLRVTLKAALNTFALKYTVQAFVEKNTLGTRQCLKS